MAISPRDFVETSRWRWAMIFRRVSYGTDRPYEVRVQILGQKILIGCFPFRSQATQAEEIANTIRKALSRAEVIKKKQSQQISFQNLNENQSEQAA
jgi:hypothetical protein